MKIFAKCAYGLAAVADVCAAYMFILACGSFIVASAAWIKSGTFGANAVFAADEREKFRSGLIGLDRLTGAFLAQPNYLAFAELAAILAIIAFASERFWRLSPTRIRKP